MVEKGSYEPEDEIRGLHDSGDGTGSAPEVDEYSFDHMSRQERINAITNIVALLIASCTFFYAGIYLITSEEIAELLLAIILFFLGMICSGIILIYLLSLKIGKEIESSKTIEAFGKICFYSFIFAPIWLPIIAGLIGFLTGYPFGLVLIGIGFIMYYSLAENLLLHSRGGRAAEEGVVEDPDGSGHRELVNDPDVEWDVVEG